MKKEVRKYLSNNGKKGGTKTKENQGIEFFSKIGKMGGRPKTKKLINQK